LLQRLEARAARRVLFESRHELTDLGRRLQLQALDSRVGESRAELHRLTHRAETALARRISRGRGDFHHVVGQLHALSPLAVLERGYSVLAAEFGVVRDARTLKLGDRVVARLHRGAVELRVEGIREELP
jgi:exodeoxyribonuclease VII large subunit